MLRNNQRLSHAIHRTSLTQNVDVKRLPIFHNGVSSIVTALRSAAELYSFAQNINDLALAFVYSSSSISYSVASFASLRIRTTPLRSEYHRSHFD